MGIRGHDHRSERLQPRPGRIARPERVPGGAGCGDQHVEDNVDPTGLFRVPVDGTGIFRGVVRGPERHGRIYSHEVEGRQCSKIASTHGAFPLRTYVRYRHANLYGGTSAYVHMYTVYVCTCTHVHASLYVDVLVRL